MSFGDGDLHIENKQLQGRVDSLEVTNGKLCDEINRQERRIRQLEALVRDIMKGDPKCTARSCADCEHDEDDGCGIYRRMRELGIEVD